MGVGMQGSSDSRTQKIKDILTEVSGIADLPFSVRLWDEDPVALGQSVVPGLELVIRSPGIISDLVRHPTISRLIDQYATGGITIEGGTLLDLAAGHDEDPRRRKLLKKLDKSKLLKAGLPFLVGKGERPQSSSSFTGTTGEIATAGKADKDYVQFHYDISNDFYRLFLDPHMQYTCGYFPTWDSSLEQAQEAKLDMICRKLRLQPGERLLDIGCGWGGLLMWAAKHYGVEGYGVTLSQEQYDLAVQRVFDAGLSDRVTIEIRDFRDVEGTFDKVSSIGMFEQVGIDHHKAYFRKIQSLLRPRGLLLNHAITRRGKPSLKEFRKKKKEYKAITDYIFPGGEVDHIGHSLTMMESNGFEVHDVENWREHYALTSEHWCKRLYANKDAAIEAIGPEKTRLWLLYLAGVSLGFRRGSIQIFQTIASKRTKGASGMPPTRADLYT